MIKLCPSSKGSPLHSLFHPQLVAHSATFNWKFKHAHSICKVLHYSEFLTQPLFLFKEFHLRFVTACAISVSSNTNWALQDAGQSMSDKGNFHPIFWFTLEPSSGSGHWLSYITVAHVKEIQWLGCQTILQGIFSPASFTHLLHL